MTTATTNIIILGGGYSGLMAVLRLAGRTKRLDTTITLVNALEQFIERPRLHEQAAGWHPTPRPIYLIHLIAGRKLSAIKKTG